MSRGHKLSKETQNGQRDTKWSKRHKMIKGTRDDEESKGRMD